VAVLGEGPPLLLLHGFDSSFLEFRRLAPLLAGGATLLIPDLFGFGFTPIPCRRKRINPKTKDAGRHSVQAFRSHHTGTGPLMNFSTDFLPAREAGTISSMR
jgi:pimeloyl-ACP methyl ester carboxylesterase